MSELTEEDRLNLADIAWFMRGLNYGKEKHDQPFADYHFNSLEKAIEAIRDQVIKSKSKPNGER
jgi:hypothetical protein